MAKHVNWNTNMISALMLVNVVHTGHYIVTPVELWLYSYLRKENKFIVGWRSLSPHFKRMPNDNTADSDSSDNANNKIKQ